METFKELFDNFIKDKTYHDVAVITELAIKLDIDHDYWFNNQFLNRDCTFYNADDFLTELLSSFIFHIEKEFDKILLQYVKEHGRNIYNEPYLSIEYELCYNDKKGFYLKNKKTLSNFIKETFTFKQKQELLKNKLFFTIVNETNLKIYSKNDKRNLKLRELDEYYKFSTE
jgi:hypothetical protein